MILIRYRLVCVGTLIACAFFLMGANRESAVTTPKPNDAKQEIGEREQRFPRLRKLARKLKDEIESAPAT